MAKILIVDDSKAILGPLQIVIESLGHQAIPFTSGADALEFARNERVELVITDLNMPIMSGMALIASIRKLDNYQGVPIVVLTTETSEYKKKKARELGANGWLTKPLTQERVSKALQATIG